MKYIVIAYLTQIKGYKFPYDIFLCQDEDTKDNCVHKVILNKKDGRYYKFEVYEEV